MIRKISIVLLIFTSISALVGGGGIINDPTGTNMELNPEWLAGTIFMDFMIPGIILFIVLGVGSAMATYTAIRRKKKYYIDIITIGIALVIWIVAQMLIINMVHYLHIIYGSLGVALIVLGVIESKNYNSQGAPQG